MLSRLSRPFERASKIEEAFTSIPKRLADCTISRANPYNRLKSPGHPPESFSPYALKRTLPPMTRSRALALSCLALLAAPALAEVRFVPIPMVGAGTIKVQVEYARDTTGPRQVDVTRIPEGVSGLGVIPIRQQVVIGPSTSTKYPLLNITPSGPGLIALNAEP